MFSVSAGSLGSRLLGGSGGSSGFCGSDWLGGSGWPSGSFVESYRSGWDGGPGGCGGAPGTGGSRGSHGCCWSIALVHHSTVGMIVVKH